MNIAVDADDVTADFTNPLVLFHNSVYGTKLRKEDFYTSIFPDVWGGTSEESSRKVNEFYETDFFKEIMPIPNSFRILSFLKSQGYIFFLVTGRRSLLTEITKNWIEKHFPNIFSGIFHANAYSTHEKKIKKSEVCKRLNIKLIIDDDMMHVLDCTSEGITVLVYDQPWNRVKLPEKAIRIFNWDEASEEIKKFKF